MDRRARLHARAGTRSRKLALPIAEPCSACSRDPQVRFGDSYSAGRIEVRGDLVEFMSVLYRSAAHESSEGTIANRLAGLLYKPRRNTLAGSRANIHRHYDLGNDFYSLWLGETMAYTCAYYPHSRRDARPGASGQDGPRLPQVAPCARRHRRRGWLRLGQLRAAHGQPLRRKGARLQYLQGTDRLRAAARARVGSRTERRVHRG